MTAPTTPAPTFPAGWFSTGPGKAVAYSAVILGAVALADSRAAPAVLGIVGAAAAYQFMQFLKERSTPNHG